MILPDALLKEIRCRCSLISSMCSKSYSSSLGNTDVSLLLYAPDAQVEDDVDKMLLIDVVQDEEVVKGVDHELEDDHDVLLYPSPPLSLKFMMLWKLSVIKLMILTPEGGDDLQKDNDVELDDVD